MAGIQNAERDLVTSEEEEGGNEPGELREQRDIVRNRCLSMVQRATSRTILGRADVQAYRDMVFSESSLELVGITSHQDKLAALRDNMHNMIPKIISDAEKLERQFNELLQKANDSGGISKVDVDKWKDRLKDPTVIYMKKKDFVTTKFKDYVENWISLGDDLKKVEEKKTKLNLNEEKVPELKPLKAAGFLDSHYLFKRDRVNAALAAIAAIEKGTYSNEAAEVDPSLYQKAKALLQKAASDEVLSEWKIGEWMKKIFQSDAKPDLIKKFITGNDAKSLRGLIKNWTEVRSDYDDVETKRNDVGSPRTFHFVHLDVFLGWHYERRKAYVAEANNRFKDIDKEPYIFLKIRHALDIKDFDEADELIARAEKGATTPEHFEKLDSMKKYLREHRGSKPKEDASVDPEQEAFEANEQLKQAISNLPTESIKNRFIRALGYDYDTMWALCTMYYNWEWCRQRGYSTEEKDLEFKEIAKEQTYDHLKHGQPDDYAVNDMTSDTSMEPAARSDNDTKSPQVIHINETTDNGALLTYVHHNCHNRAVWYWTRLVEKDVPFDRIQEMIHHVQPVLKKNMRVLEKHGYGFSLNGSPHKKGNSLSAPATKKIAPKAESAFSLSL
ncbi:MAG TPA: hypothetical protein VI873_02255 [Candidatus Peribacteraceae bacterium]|nr:hypothetical protein [Candidatus Peribacteraceae bacterium]